MTTPGGHQDDDDPDDGAQGSATDEAVTRGMEALQTAAQEMISAARAMLDVAEGLVRDPNAASSMLGAFNAVARAATRFAPDGSSAADDQRRDDDGDSGVRHIPVS